MQLQKPTLNECFPDLLTRQWPSTANPVTCECRQLYVLVALCCCVPRTHLLVLHDVQRNHAVTSMPKGPKYVDYTITARTTVDDMCAFLLRAEAASSSLSVMSPLSDMAPVPATTMTTTTMAAAATAAWSTTARGCGAASDGGNNNNNMTTATAARPGAVMSSGGNNNDTLHEGDVQSQQQQQPSRRVVVVVCLYGLAAASAAVQSALMDVLTLAQVPVGSHRAEAVPSLRVVAFCSYRFYGSLLPPSLRAAFALSTFMSTLAMDSAAVLQNSNYLTSSVVNKANMIAAMHARDGLARSATVTLAAAVARYLRHLLLVVCGSLSPTSVVGTQLLQRLPHMHALLRVAALLFMPEDVHELPLPPHLRRTSSQHMQQQQQQEQQEQQEQQTLRYSNGDDNDKSDTYHASTTRRRAASVSSPSSTYNYSYIVVSPSDVLGLLPSLLTHVLTLSRDVTLPADVVAVMQESVMQSMGGGGGGGVVTSASLSVEQLGFTSRQAYNNSSAAALLATTTTTPTAAAAVAVEQSLWDVLVTSRAALSFASRRHWSNASAAAAAAAAVVGQRDRHWTTSHTSPCAAHGSYAVNNTHATYYGGNSSNNNGAARAAMGEGVTTMSTAPIALHNNNNNNNAAAAVTALTTSSFAAADASVMPDVSLQLSMLSAQEVLAALALQQQQQQMTTAAAAGGGGPVRSSFVAGAEAAYAFGDAASNTRAQQQQQQQQTSPTPHATGGNSTTASPATVALRAPPLAALVASRASLTGLLNYCEAVRGHDTTFVRRMSVAEYAAELRNEAAVATATRVQRGDGSRRSSSNRSDDDDAVDDDDGEGVVSRSDVTFTCRFPLRDRLGRQLCVLYQVQDTAVADELRRLRSEANVAATSSSRTTAAAAADEPVGRRSGVRLSNELDVAYTAGGNEDNSSGGGVPWRCAAGGRGDVARKRQRRASSSSSLTNNTDDDDDSVSCASTSLVMDSGNDMHSSQGAHALLVGGDVCDYTLYRDSDGAQSSSVRGTTQHNNSNNSNSSHNVLVDRLHAALSRAHSAPLQRGSRLGTLRDAATTTTTTTACAHTTDDKENATHDSVTNTASTTNAAAAVAASSLRCASAPRVHRVYFADEAAVQQRRSATCTRQSPLPVVTTTGHAHNNNNNNTSVAAAAAAVTPAIGSSSYGADAATIAAHKVHALMEQQWCTRYGMCNSNTVSSRRRVKDEDEASDNSARTQGHDAACTSAPALPPYGCIVDCRDTPAPELCCGSVVTLGCAGDGQQQQQEKGEQQQDEAKEQQQQDEGDVRGYRRRYALQHFCAAAEVYVATDVTARPDAHDSDTTSETASTAAATTASARQVLLYRWHTTSQSRLETKETWRAAAGIAACMPVVASRGGGGDKSNNNNNNNNTTTTAAASLPPTAVHVHGYCYADGVGVTVLVLPPSYKAVCVGAVSLLLEATSYATLLKMTTRALAALVARRLVHGRLDCLDVLFLALPSTMTTTAATAAAATAAITATMTPLLLPVHWERCVDFSMFVDRDAGRTLPYDSEDAPSPASSSSSSLLTIGSDVLTLLPCLLQHRLSRELTAQQHTLLHRLTVMAAEATTHVADLLLHMTRLMQALPSNTAASLSAAVDHIRAAMMV